jgi:hypothetical protein
MSQEQINRAKEAIRELGKYLVQEMRKQKCQGGHY